MNVEKEIRLLHKEIALKNKEIAVLNKITDRHNKTEEWRFKVKYCNICRILVLPENVPPIEERLNLTMEQLIEENTCPNCEQPSLI